MRTPASVLDAAQIHLEQLFDVQEEARRIVIEPLLPTSYNIARLVAGITDENQHEPIETGAAAGLEVW